MNVTTSTFSPTQMILAWTLLALLLGWLIIFAVLALRVFVMKNAERDDLSTPSKPLSTISAQPAGGQLQYISAVTGDRLPKSVRSEASRDIDITSIK